MAYTVQWGDNLSSIANKYGTTWENIYNLNKDLIDRDARAHGVTRNFQNYIYANQNLNIPGIDDVVQPEPEPVVEQPAVQSTPTVAQPATPTKSTQELAHEYATAQTANTSNDTQALLDMYEKIAEQQKQALQNSKLQTQNQINSQRQGVLDSYQDNARQAYINSMLAKQNVGQQLSQAGLNTSGIVGSAYSNVESAYGNNLASLQANRDYSIRNIDTQLNNANLEYARLENQLAAEVEQAKIELQKYGNELAYNRYQNALNNYMNFANFDYSKEQDANNMEYQRQKDATNLEYQRARDAIADEQWQKEYELALRQLEASQKKTSVSSGSSRSGTSSSSSSGGNWAVPSDMTVYEDANNNLQENNRGVTMVGPMPVFWNGSPNTTNNNVDKQVERHAESIERILQSTSKNSKQRQMLLQQLVRSNVISASDYAELMAQ